MSKKTIIVKNRKTDVRSKLTSEQWEKAKKDPLFENTFVVVSMEDPPELKEFKPNTTAQKSTRKNQNLEEKPNEKIETDSEGVTGK